MSFQPRILVCLASEQIMQNALPALRLRPAHIVIAVSDSLPAHTGAWQVARVLHNAGWPVDEVRIVEHISAASPATPGRWPPNCSSAIRVCRSTSMPAAAPR
jgi:hypothetical protein